MILTDRARAGRPIKEFLSPGVEVESIMKYLERREEPEGYTLMRQGDPPIPCIFLNQVQITVQLHGKGETVRLRTMGPVRLSVSWDCT